MPNKLPQPRRVRLSINDAAVIRQYLGQQAQAARQAAARLRRSLLKSDAAWLYRQLQYWESAAEALEWAAKNARPVKDHDGATVSSPQSPPARGD